ncbi:helix-turn-helix transcriptional regulator [Halarcobacter anaerophilus]|uniref:DNA-binding protein n=1 Tax=Halarcobacter anaerophilus TaxID=877500 RepID=A0A4Q0Y2J1_9BACT|nr:hypothetical protein [Halarcobacter anaerophilus]QDF29917.1 hypothetical protein AANAER_2461 [Halarcobacter anaerophilus]RXJ62879.1 hypothetical protein CRV06_08575 [Halarcobacter anaerophilus]
MSANDRFLQIEEVAKIMGIGKTKANELVDDTDFIKPIIIDGFARRLFSHLELQEWMKARREDRNKNKDTLK